MIKTLFDPELWFYPCLSFFVSVIGIHTLPVIANTFNNWITYPYMFSISVIGSFGVYKFFKMISEVKA